ncbi:2062_t:CDS:1 [Funneliformis caledonium]|uniref:2062_t:CDS:1 n=1 Tax=Funneliformis caledonium TaxID=1117310 RepID=A0A9N9E6N3_9GLOM|nr:2062_t:CDS:1 [Funneliformis caledonium]
MDRNQNQIIFHFFDPETLNTSEIKPKKRTPNMFISYRNEMMKDRPLNIPMTKFSRMVSKEWKKLSEYEKAKWQRKYHISRDATDIAKCENLKLQDEKSQSGGYASESEVALLISPYPEILKNDFYLPMII